MAKKQDAFYFEKFLASTDYAYRAAELLNEVMKNFDPSTLKQRLDEMHVLEHSGDKEKHTVLDVLNKAFITPIEREDIMILCQNIDDMTDKIEDVLLRIYCNNIQTIRPDAIEISETLIQSCEAAKQMMEEFADYKHSKTLHDYVIKINSLEEKADGQFIESMHTLHTTCSDPLLIIEWREIYIYLEKCVDACEHLADSVEGVVMKNS